MSSPDSAKKRFHLHTLGCKVNQYESQAIRESLIGAGFEESPAVEGADVYVVNTCTVTEKADRESRSLVGAFARSNPSARIVVTGCYVEKDAGEFASIPGVTHIVKNSHKNRLAEILSRHDTAYGLRLMTGVWLNKPITGFKGHTKAFVKIQDGCENACAYCKVPLVRGPSRSRMLGEIIDEASGLVAAGFREIVLTGICLGAWGRELDPAGMASRAGIGRASLSDVIGALGGIGGDFRIRLSSIEPKYVTPELIEVIASDRRVCRHLHIPLQSGDDAILGRMNRPYTQAGFAEMVEGARRAIDGLAVTTDVMIGFPGETSAQFRRTLDFVRHLGPARTHIFTFSRRPGTAAYGMDGSVEASEVRRRYCELEGAALNAAYLFARSFIGRTLKVLVEDRRDERSGLLTGYTDNYIKVLFKGPDALRGHIEDVRIASADPLKTTGVHVGHCGGRS